MWGGGGGGGVQKDQLLQAATLSFLNSMSRFS